ncbi:hypothetical protein D6D01_05743 [Aureobasidium pullulans]|uniref:Uncharacterized protein n=1 Tax=Aureobasidium pullulans TaxID=5580 RepID=A0A4S9L689_AURPU|nr:hypothetical protein D6D01_05743 [Aureobasidium pullulans]
MANPADSWPVMSEQAADDGITYDSWSVSNEIQHGAKSLGSESEAEPICRRRSASRPRLPFLGTYAISSVPHPHLFRPPSTTQSPRLEPLVPFEDTLLDGFDIEVLDLDLFNSIDGSTDYQDDVFLDVITSIPESQIVEPQSQPNVLDEAEVLVLEAPDELEIRSSRSVAHPSLTQYDISVDWTSVYKGYWGNNCLSALHPVFHKITDLISQAPVLEDAIVALAACNLSRSSPKPRSPGVAGNVSYQPHPEHWASSQQHYRSALTATQHMTEAVAQGSSSQARKQSIGLPNEYARPAYSVGSDTGTDSSSQKGFNGKKTGEAAWLTSQRLAIQNLGEHLKEATGYITALVKILDAVEDLRKGHKKEFEFPDDLSTSYNTCLPIQEPFDHAGALAATLADKVLEYADGVSVALSAVQKLKYNGKARESSETAGRNAEECLISQVPSLFKAAEVLHGLYKIVERCKFEEDSEVPRFSTRDNVEGLKRREQELWRLKNGVTGWVRELQNLGVDL